MEKDLLRVLQACVVAVILLGTAILVFGLFPSMKSEAGAAWVQAVGSIAAVGGVAWTVKTQERFRRDEAQVRATVVAAAQTLQIISVSAEVRSIQLRFQTIQAHDCPPDHFSELLSKLEAIPTWSADELSYLAALPNQIAFKLAGGIDRLNATILILRKLVGHPDIVESAEFRKEKAQFFSFSLNESALLFNIASTRMQLLTHGPTGPYG